MDITQFSAHIRHHRHMRRRLKAHCFAVIFVISLRNGTLLPTSMMEQTTAQVDTKHKGVLDSPDNAHGQAAELLEGVVEIRKTTLDPEHLDRLASQHEVARAYMGNGQHRRAAELLEEVVEIQKTTLDPEHPSRLASQHELARAYMGNGQHRRAYQANGQVKDAVQLLEHVVKIREQIQAEDHPDRLASQHELAGAYQANGQVEGAVQLLEHVVKIREQIQSEDHPNRPASPTGGRAAGDGRD